MRRSFSAVLIGTVLGCAPGAVLYAQTTRSVAFWLTDPAHAVYFQQQPDLLFSKAGAQSGETVIAIDVDEKKIFQHMDGFGWALTGGSARALMRMSPGARGTLLRELFTTDGNPKPTEVPERSKGNERGSETRSSSSGRTDIGIGGSYLRVSIGASDLNDHAFSYDDLPSGQTDTAMEHFDLGPDRQDVIPVLQEIVKISPAIRILASPWSAPAWMKSNHDTRGGNLVPKYYAAYTRYLVRYILAMQQQGLRIDALTVQNEPLNPGNNPSMVMQAVEEAEFIKHYLGPAIQQERLDTKIIVYDHNCDRPDYPLAILKDPEANPYVDGSAFHLYAGPIDTLSSVHDAFPDKNLYFTEQWVGAPGNMRRDIPEHIRNLIIGATRNWCKTVVEWNLASDPHYQPHTDRGGCDRCLGALTIEGDSVQRNPGYYIIAHAAKFVPPGSARIPSNSDDALPNVAFRTPWGKAVLIVLNNTAAMQTFTVEIQGRLIHPTLNAGAVGTFVFLIR